MNPIEEYYGKFNEDKRLISRHGQVEYLITQKYINECIESVMERFCIDDANKSDLKIIDVGAGTGAYCLPLSEQGYSVSAVELVKHNLGRLKQKAPCVEARQGDARNLKKYQDESFHIVLLLGPMYHLFSHEDKLKAMSEAKRVCKSGGYILVAYLLNEYGFIMYALNEGHLRECLEQGRINEDFHCSSTEKDLYDYIRIEDIDRINSESNLKRVKIITPDGPTNYIRPAIKELKDEDFRVYIKYVESIAERQDMIGAAAHVVDILEK